MMARISSSFFSLLCCIARYNCWVIIPLLFDHFLGFLGNESCEKPHLFKADTN